MKGGGSIECLNDSQCQNQKLHYKLQNKKVEMYFD
jgi:hypothetical protein